MPITTSLNPKLLRPGLRAIYGMEMAEWPEEYSKIFDSTTSSMSYEEYQELAGFGLINEQSQGSNVTNDEILNSFTNQVKNTTYGMGYLVTREMIDDSMYNLIARFPKALAKSVRLTVETLGANVLNTAFDSAYFFGDTKELCATDHPLPGGGTFSNEPSSPADLSATSLEQAFLDIRAIVDPRGNVAMIKPKRLIISSGDHYTAAQLLGSDKTPEDENNSINPVKTENLLPGGYVINDFKTDPDSWFIKTDQEGAICQKRIWPAEFREDNDFKSLNIQNATYFRMRFWVYDPRSIYGSPGA